MNATHTPGPWHCYADVPSTEPNWHIVTSDTRTRIVANVHIEPGNAIDAANAKLIAAAPDLLEALIAIEAKLTKAANAFYVDGKLSNLRAALADWKPIAGAARAAIDKATK